MISTLDPRGLTVFVTGATAGFGRAVCRHFHRAGAKVIGVGRRRERLEALKAELGERCHVAQLDVRDRDGVFRAFETLPVPFEAPNICVANAGLALGSKRAQDADIADWEQMVCTNINGVLNTVRAVLPGMVERDEGHIILLGSAVGDYPSPTTNVYGASKAFVRQFGLSLRADLMGTKVRVTNIEPGMSETEFSLVRAGGDAQKAAAVYEGIDPISAEDIAETIFWSCTLPRHLNVNRLQIMPVQQAFGPFAISRVATTRDHGGPKEP
ncbi:3-hydroxy acid dehydrogenase [Hyphomicrobiales bacterium]|nr:3-hydroxy acid dehydrogenase [Hyphomicrobiales bacterium]CAH1695491.1 3-hydroxy acid dehydrogenase YdfG [Hyphomicrobiales bacterium]